MQLAAAEPEWTRLAIPIVGVGLFTIAVSFRQRRPPPARSLVVLTIVLGLWSFAAGLVWSKRGPSMIRWSGGWVDNPGAWEWTALLGLVLLAVVLAGVALRAFSEGRMEAAVALTAGAAAAFGAWTVVVRFSVDLAVIGGGLALAALAGDALARPGPLPAPSAAPAHPAFRTLGIALATASIAAAAIVGGIALLWPTGG